MVKLVRVGNEEIETPSFVRLPGATRARSNLRTKDWVGSVAEKFRKIQPVSFAAATVRALFDKAEQWKVRDQRLYESRQAWVRRQHRAHCLGRFKVGPGTSRERQNGAGRKKNVPEIRIALFDWFVDTRRRFARISRNVFREMALQMYRMYVRHCEDADVEAEKMVISFILIFRILDF